MNISQVINWPATNWPSTTPATQYTVLQIYPGSTPVHITESSTTSATITFDDSQNLVYQVRPSSGTYPTLTYGPEAGVFVVNYVPNRAWLRNKIRQSLADRADTVGATINWPDDEINNYIQEALTELNLLFPAETTATPITLLPPTIVGGVSQGVRQYALPSDFFRVRTVEYVTVDGKLHKFLKEKPWRGGESTATSYIGYPKLGIAISPLAGRYFPGNYFVFQNTLNLDWDPVGDGDYLNVTYYASRPLPTDDGTAMNLTPQDMEILSLYAQMKCWLRVEGQDTRLSRWRSRDDGSKRDDMPTLKHSEVIKRLYNERVHDRRELRVATRRLVRR